MVHMVWAALAVLLCFGGAVLQLAVHRSPDVPDNDMVRAARRVTCAALLVVCIYVVDRALDGYVPSPVACLAAALLGLGQMLYAINTMRKHGVQKATRGHHA